MTNGYLLENLLDEIGIYDDMIVLYNNNPDAMKAVKNRIIKVIKYYGITDIDPEELADVYIGSVVNDARTIGNDRVAIFRSLNYSRDAGCSLETIHYVCEVTV